jgi:hypothetical protein
MNGPNNNIRRKIGDITRAANDIPIDKEQQIVLMMVKSSTLVKDPNPNELASFYTWRYTVCPAKITWAGLGNSPTVGFWNVGGSPEYYAFSVSELANTSSVYSYGHNYSDLPNGIFPRKIPNNTPVLCVPSSLGDGTFIYLIVNTQALAGECQ